MAPIGALSSLNSYIPTPVLRDMGKTIYAGVSTNSGSTIGTVGAFRAVQILNPVTVAAATSVTNFGVNGSVGGTIPSGNAGDDGYNTFYIPIVSGGVVAQNATLDYGVGPIPGNVN